VLRGVGDRVSDVDGKIKDGIVLGAVHAEGLVDGDLRVNIVRRQVIIRRWMWTYIIRPASSSVQTVLY
jgi:hypothetical protein